MRRGWRWAIASTLLLAPALSWAERVPTAVLWLDPARPELAQALEGALAASSALRPIDDTEARRTLVEGGPGVRIGAALEEARQRAAAMQANEADRALAQAESIALAELPADEACPRLVEIERTRLRYAELVKDEERARAAARLLGACLASPSPDEAALLSKHGVGPGAATEPARTPPRASKRAGGRAAAVPVHVESDPAGADVLLDLHRVGKTPIELPASRRPGAFVDIELAGYRKVHRVVPEIGSLTVALARDDRIAALVDRIRGAAGDAAEADVSDLGRRVGAARVLVVRGEPGAADRAQARVLDVASGRWWRAAASFPLSPGSDGDGASRLLAYAAGPADVPAAASSRPAAAGAAAAATAGSPPPPGAATASPKAAPRKSPPDQPLANRATERHNAAVAAKLATDTGKPPAPRVPAWKKWYTWVTAGAVLLGVGAFVVAEHVGDDQITINVTH